MLAFLKFAEIYISSSKGVYIVSFLSGLADTDAITISLAQAAGNSISYGTARNGIILGVLANVATKGCIAFVFGEKKFSSIVLGIFLLLILVGLGLIFIL